MNKETEKEQILKLVEVMLDKGIENMSWQIIQPDWTNEVYEREEGFTKITYDLRIKRYETHGDRDNIYIQ